MIRMNRINALRFSLLVFCGFGVAACQNGSDDVSGSETASTATTVHSEPATRANESRGSPGKPSAPINIEYEIMGQAVIGVPLSINVKVTSALDEPIAVNYRIHDPTSLMFTAAQAERVSLVPIGEDAFSEQQVTVIPQREGRVYLNVAAEIDTDIGMMAKVMAIPIQVGSLRRAPTPNGELTTGEDGEALISMPAQED